MKNPQNSSQSQDEGQELSQRFIERTEASLWNNAFSRRRFLRRTGAVTAAVALLSLGKLEVQAITSSTHKPSEDILEVTYSGSPVKTDEVAVEIWKQTAPPAVDTIKVHAGGQRSTWSGDPQAGNFVAPPIAGYTREGWIQSPNQVEDSSLTYTLFLEENTDGYAPPEPRKSHWETQKVTNYKWSGLYKYKKAL